MPFNWSGIGNFLSGSTTQNSVSGGGTTTETATNYGAIIIASVAILATVGTAVLIFEETKGAKT